MKKKLNLKWQNFVWLTVSGIVNSIGVTLFLAPLKLFDSGLSGTSMLLWQVLPFLPMSLFLVCLNLPFFIIGFKKQGLSFTVYSLYAVAIYSLAAYLIQNVIPLDLTKSPFAGDNMFLCSVFGGLISGAGSGLTIRFGGAIDGIEVMAVIFAKYIGMTIGTFVMAYNAILYTIAGFVMHSFEIPLFSVIAYAAGLKSVDFIVDGFDKAKAAIIITTKGYEISKRISASLGRSITIIDAKGFYSGNAKNMLYCVVNRFQIGRLKKIISEVDEGAFVTISDISDTLGTSLKLAKKRKSKSDGNSAQKVIEDILKEDIDKISVLTGVEYSGSIDKSEACITAERPEENIVSEDKNEQNIESNKD